MLLPPSEYTQYEQHNGPGNVAPVWHCWEEDAAPCGHRFCLVCGDPMFVALVRRDPPGMLGRRSSTS
eukprot:12879641-Heterocapsa_arctica.AAC.1